MENLNFNKLIEQLELQEWPQVYFFKFIVPNNPKQIAQVGNLFSENTEINLQPSKNNTYISISAKEMMIDVNSVIEIYKKASLIEGIISL